MAARPGIKPPGAAQAKPPALNRNYKIVEKDDQTSKVVLSKQARSPTNALMPGVGKVVGSIGKPQISGTTVLRTHGTRVDNNQGPSLIKP